MTIIIYKLRASLGHNTIIILFLTNCLSAQILFTVEREMDFPAHFSRQDFVPQKINVGPGGIYFLDTDSRQIALMSSEEVRIEGGYGIGADIFFDPIEILVSGLRVWIVDGTLNTISEFDHRLNFLRTFEMNNIYPDIAALDTWENVFLWSDQDQMIYKLDLNSGSMEEFVDFTLYRSSINQVLDLVVTPDGSVFLLVEKEQLIYHFNRLGRLVKILKYDQSIKFIAPFSERSFLISESGFIADMNEQEKFQLPILDQIVDVAVANDQLFMLMQDGVKIIVKTPD
ncbi:MAG: hypothetical protein V3U16_03840 [Candidatus Neomarinimicrobiota bacterium]